MNIPRLFAAMLVFAWQSLVAADPMVVEYTVKRETVMKQGERDKVQWFHPRAAAIPSPDGGEPLVVMTIQKHLEVSDYFSGLHVLTQPARSAPWTGPDLPKELDCTRSLTA